MKIYANPVFVPANETNKLYVIMKGSAGSGKSVDTSQHYILRLLKEKGRNLLCVRKSECTHRQSTYAELMSAIYRMKLEKYFISTSNPLRIKCINGNEIAFRGINSDAELEKIKSITFQHGKLTDIWIEEATELQERYLNVLSDRLRGNLPQGLFYQMRLTFNPVNVHHWIKRIFFDTPREDTFLHHSTYLNNRFIGEEYHKRAELRKQLDPEGYKIYFLGEWGELDGLIFTNWEYGDISLNDNDYDDVYLGQDFGFTHNNAIIKIGFKDGDLYVLQEHVENQKDSNEIIKTATDKGINKNTLMFCDEAEPDRINMWRSAGYYAVPCTKGAGSVKAQIDWLKQRRIFVHPSCVQLGKELSQWRWDKDKISGMLKEEPIKINDDCIAALRYAIQYYRELYPVNTKSVNVKR